MIVKKLRDTVNNYPSILQSAIIFLIIGSSLGILFAPGTRHAIKVVSLLVYLPMLIIWLFHTFKTNRYLQYIYGAIGILILILILYRLITTPVLNIFQSDHISGVIKEWSNMLNIGAQYPVTGLGIGEIEPSCILFAFWLNFGLFGLLSLVLILTYILSSIKQFEILHLVILLYLLLGLTNISFFRPEIILSFWWFVGLFIRKRLLQS